MKRTFNGFTLVVLLTLTAVPSFAQRKPATQEDKGKPAASKQKTPAAQPKPAAASKPLDEDALKAELDEALKLDVAARVERLAAFVKANPDSPQTLRAQELLTSARAALGDQKLRGGDYASGVELFRAAVKEAPDAMSDRLFVEVLAQLPANLYMLGERGAGLDLARAVEARAEGNATRLLSVASFYLSIERPEETARLAQAAITLKPDMAVAHQALGVAHRFSLRLEEAAAEYARAAELDPKNVATRRALAELRRATGKAEDAATLYREMAASDPQDTAARAGLVLALFDAGRREEAERELRSALTGEARDLPLLVGASYWYAARGDGARALELAEKALAFESRFGWAWTRVAQGRALLALKRPLDAERAFRAARRFGNFATLDYELAAALAAAGLYDEAAEQLARSFTLRDGKIVTRLAGRIETSAADFNELLAPERRASFAQFEGASTAAEARTLKALLALNLATAPDAPDARAATEAAREFATGDDVMRAYRNVYAANRLEQLGGAAAEALARAEAAIGGVEPALGVAHAPIALFAETQEMKAMRRQVVEQDAPLNMLAVDRDTISRVLRGRIEGLAGWALYNQGQTAEAVVRLRRAVSVLPEDSAWWRTAEWRLGAALEASGSGRDALAAYVRSYRALPDPERLPVIEALYKKLNNGSANGLEKLLGTPVNVAAATTAPAPSTSTPTPTPSPAPEPEPTPVTTPTPEPSPVSPPATEATPAASPSPSPEPEKSSTPEATPTPADAEATPSPSPTPTPEAASPTTTQTPTPEPSPGAARDGKCMLTLGDTALNIKSNGGRAAVWVGILGYTGQTPPSIKSSTPNWADIAVLAEPHKPEDGNGARFLITSTSAKTGAFTVAFTSPCGKAEVTVNVQ
ncbi:MAG TPA: tetratricopeptide repeat protein [Pyrinomonadaceae bacterium]